VGLCLARAQEVSSTNYKVSTPEFFEAGMYATSSNYQLYGLMSQPAIGTSTATSFGLNPGFLFFPFVTTPIVTATPGNAQVS
jgi:hypothetical protein